MSAEYPQVLGLKMINILKHATPSPIEREREIRRIWNSAVALGQMLRYFIEVPGGSLRARAAV